jgi:CDP-diacylglycerol--glycerol-3-phosphate 3-phosphatidyltransferase
MRWGIPTAMVLSGFLLRLRKSLDRNHPPGDPGLRPSLGAANFLTIARAVLTASLAGFLFQAPTVAAGAAWDWLPGLVYLSVAALDYADGRLARITNNVTCLGAYLDTQIDALGLLLAALLLVLSAKAPLPYLWVGMGYYVLQAAIHLRRTAGRPVNPVPPRPDARWIAGCAMATAAMALLPIFKPEATWPAAWVMTFAMGISLGQDWHIVCGDAAGYDSTLSRAHRLLRKRLTRNLPLVLRLAVAASLFLTFCASPVAGRDDVPLLVQVGALTSAALCVFGVVVRAAAMLLSMLCALWLVPTLPANTTTVALMAALALMLMGSGRPRFGQSDKVLGGTRDAGTTR